MKAMVLHRFHEPLKMEDVEIPEIGHRDVLIRVKACGVAYGDLSVKDGHMGGNPPIVPGWEVAGEVEEIGDDVQGLRKGDRVAVSMYLTCGACRFCRTNRDTLCINSRGYVGVHINGGYAEYMEVPVENILKIPSNVSFEQASIVADTVGTSLHAIKERAAVKIFDDVLIVGAGGGVGIHAVQVAKLFGGRVIATDISEEKLEMAKKYGADEVINAKLRSFDDEVKRLTNGRGVDAVIDNVAVLETLQASLRSLAVAGRLVVVGVRTGISFGIDPTKLVMREIVITGARNVTKLEMAEALELVGQGRVKSIVTKTFPLHEAELAHELLRADKITGRSVLVP